MLAFVRAAVCCKVEKIVEFVWFGLGTVQKLSQNMQCCITAIVADVPLFDLQGAQSLRGVKGCKIEDAGLNTSQVSLACGSLMDTSKSAQESSPATTQAAAERVCTKISATNERPQHLVSAQTCLTNE